MPKRKPSNITVDPKYVEMLQMRNPIDPDLELVDPTPNIYVMFQVFDARFFQNQLNACEVKWSPQMTQCAGICCYAGRSSGYCSIRLSKPLLALRPRKDLVETLLHEMIHALLFINGNRDGHDGHGPEFQSHMYRINNEIGSNISIYHSFHNEVNHYRQHWWRCNGSCRTSKPYFGYVKRSKNRAPSKNDLWWAEHQVKCGGEFLKVKEPENYGKKVSVRNKKENVGDAKGDGDAKQPTIFDFFNKNDSPSPKKIENSPTKKLFPGEGQLLGGSIRVAPDTNNDGIQVLDFLPTNSNGGSSEKKDKNITNVMDLIGKEKTNLSSLRKNVKNNSLPYNRTSGAPIIEIINLIPSQGKPLHSQYNKKKCSEIEIIDEIIIL